ncbi:MAG TPA: helix-hairpin-helix domain-containing protein [Chitinophagales bacterium]|nr:helix-hairpin-helix domain-containing protein [Chitinophagales bacterium]
MQAKHSNPSQAGCLAQGFDFTQRCNMQGKFISLNSKRSAYLISSNDLLLLLCLLLPAFFPFETAAQKKQVKEYPEILKEDIRHILESISEETDESFNFDAYLEQLADLQKNPLNLNKATYDELLVFRLLTAKQADAIIRHREKYGDFISIYELQSVKDFDLITIYRILPFVTVKGDLDDYQLHSFRQLISEGDFELFLRCSQILEEQKGYAPLDSGEAGQRYLGNPSKIYTRFRYSFPNKLSYGFTAEKDAGEEVFKGSQPRGFDFYSGHFFVKNVSVFKCIAAGDYEMKTGQGLVMYSGFGFGKSPLVTSIKKTSETLRPYTSVDENNFLRGAAATADAGDFEITGFFSRDRKDANIAEADTSDDEALIAQATSLLESGLHRTESELEDKDAVRLTAAGGYLKYRRRASHIGLSAVHTRLNFPLEKGNEPYNQYEFYGDRLTNFGADYALLVKNFYFFGEFAMTDKLAISTLHGCIASLDPKVDMALLYRYFQRDYFSFFSNPFSESRKPYNERGIYAGLSVRPVKNFQLDSYLDYYRFPWLRYQADAPSSGLDFLAQLTWRPSKKLEIYGRYKNETKEGNAPENTGNMNMLTPIGKQNIRWNVKYKVSESVSFENRFECVIYDDGEKENGFLIYQDITYKSLSFPLSVSGRFVLFDTYSYDARVYTYEDDVLYYHFVPAYYSKGTRFYFVLRYKAARWLDLWLKFGQTYFANQDTIGSGLDEIDGNVRSEMRGMVKVKF